MKACRGESGETKKDKSVVFPLKTPTSSRPTTHHSLLSLVELVSTGSQSNDGLGHDDTSRRNGPDHRVNRNGLERRGETEVGVSLRVGRQCE